MAEKGQNSIRSKNRQFQFFESKEEVCVEKCWYSCSQLNFVFLTIFFQWKNKVQDNLFWHWPFFHDFHQKKLSNLFSCSKFSSNLHQYHIFLKKLFYCEKDIKYRFLVFYYFGLLLATQNKLFWRSGVRIQTKAVRF